MFSLVHRVKEKLIKKLYHAVSRGVDHTEPVSNFCEQSNLVVLSMVRSADLKMLMVALKSFAQYVTLHHFVIVTDEDVSEVERLWLKKHLVHVEFLAVAEVRHAALPKGGCWERLTAIALTCEKYYVVQLDADTITYHSPDQVLSCIQRGVAFTLGTTSGQQISLIDGAVAFAKAQQERGNTHIQILCESRLGVLKSQYAKYVRGCAGFVGFPKGSLSLSDLLEVNRVYAGLGLTWSAWGTEQFTSNLLIANTPQAEVLPLCDYDTAPKGKVFGHYIGTVRFSSLMYIKDTRRFLKRKYASRTLVKVVETSIA